MFSEVLFSSAQHSNLLTHVLPKLLTIVYENSNYKSDREGRSSGDRTRDGDINVRACTYGARGTDSFTSSVDSLAPLFVRC